MSQARAPIRPATRFHIYIAVLIGGVWFSATAMFVGSNWLTSRAQEIENTRTEYHLASALSLDEAGDILAPFRSQTPGQGGDPTDETDWSDRAASRLSRALYVVKQCVASVAQLQSKYPHPDSAQPLRMLEDEIQSTDRLLGAMRYDSAEDQSRLRDRVEMLAIRIQQLRLLHLASDAALDTSFAGVWRMGNVLLGGTAIVMCLVGGLVVWKLYTAIRSQQDTLGDLLEANVRAESATQAKSDFLANMSHEIRTPMTAILGFSESLRDSSLSESERLDFINIICRNGSHLLGIVNDILDLSKVESGKLRMEYTTCESCRFISDVANLDRIQVESKNLTFKIEYDGAIPATFRTDVARLRQILINLIGNAIRFTDAGSIGIMTRLVHDGDNPQMQFDVTDTGRGMSPDTVAGLFQPFNQADSSTTREFCGTGLGLTISKRFAVLLGGDVTLVRTEVGVGSTFRATVATGDLKGVTMLADPIAATKRKKEAPAVKTTDSQDLSNRRILLAEDGPDNQRLISIILKLAGAAVTVAGNGELAVEAAFAARDEGLGFDCILMDMQMPVLDGYEAAAQLRSRGYTGPIIALTAHAMTGDRDKCIQAGCDDHATKPINRKRLIEMIQAHLQHASA